MTFSTILVYDPSTGVSNDGVFYVATRIRADDNHYTAVYAKPFPRGKQEEAVVGALQKAQECAEARALITGEQEDILFVVDLDGYVLVSDEACLAVESHPSFAERKNVNIPRISPYGRLEIAHGLPYDQRELLQDGYLSRVIGQL